MDSQVSRMMFTYNAPFPADAQFGGPRFALDTMCPAVSTPIAKPTINVPNRSAALGIVTVRNKALPKNSWVNCGCLVILIRFFEVLEDKNNFERYPATVW